MRILLVIYSLLQGGGTETHVLSLARQFRRHGHEVGIYTTGGPWVSVARRHGIRVHLGRFRSGSLASVIRQRQYRVVHAHDTPSFRILARVTPPANTRFLMTVHGLYMDPQNIRRCSRRCQNVIAVSRSLQTYVLSTCKVPSDKVIVIENGISTGRYRRRSLPNARRQLGLPVKARIIGYAGRFTLDKANLGVRVVRALTRYARHHKGVQVVVAGRNASRYLRSTTHRKVFGHVDQMSTFYNACDVMVGAGRVALESLSSQVPTIAVGSRSYEGPILSANLSRAAGGNFGDHALTAKDWSGHQLRQDVHRLLSASPNLHKAVEDVCRTVRREFANRTIATRIEHVYRSSKR